jgi:hypothetical protein
LLLRSVASLRHLLLLLLLQLLLLHLLLSEVLLVVELLLLHGRVIPVAIRVLVVAGRARDSGGLGPQIGLAQVAARPATAARIERRHLVVVLVVPPTAPVTQVMAARLRLLMPAGVARARRPYVGNAA